MKRYHVWHGNNKCKQKKKKIQNDFRKIVIDLFFFNIFRPHETVAPQPLSAADLMHTAAAQLNDKALITVCMEADEHGRFGFNVRGGTDVNLPVLVARIAPHSPADRVVPKIKEGDNVLLINGHDVNGLTHNQVVNLIKSTREHNPYGQLVLTIKPNVEETAITEEEEPICQYVPDNYVENLKYDDAIFSQSVFLLRDGLASGALLEQFEQLYKKNDNLTISESKKEENMAKNRYRDILPCKHFFFYIHLSWKNFFPKYLSIFLYFSPR